MRAAIIALLLTIATQAGAEVVMVCDAANNEKRYYKLVQPLFGDNTVEQKLDGQWINWCKANCKDFEVYASSAKQSNGDTRSWPTSDPNQEIEASRKYYLEDTYLLDFEFGWREVQSRLFTDSWHSKELKKWRYRGTKTYDCKIKEPDGYFKMLSGTINGVIQ